jgi:ferritin-like protein
MASEGFHEPLDLLRQITLDRHRATVSLMEELEATDWYDQRIDATKDDDLRTVLTHNRDEEKEHAAMVLEWLRRHDPKLDEHLREWLFTDRPFIASEDEEAEAEGAGGSAGGADGTLGVGSLYGEVML